MKNYKWLMILLLLFLFGCGKKSFTTCSIDVTNEVENYTFQATYKIYDSSSFVTKIEKVETYKSDDKYILEYFKEYAESSTNNLNSLYGGYTYLIDETEKKVIIKSVIDVKNIDVTKMVKDGYLDKYYVTSSKLSLGGIKLFYKAKGASCDI